MLHGFRQLHSLVLQPLGIYVEIKDVETRFDTLNNQSDRPLFNGNVKKRLDQ